MKRKNVNKVRWIKMKMHKPPYDGLFLIFAPSADPKKPFMHVAWWNESSQGWDAIVKCWGDAITHWAEMPERPR